MHFPKSQPTEIVNALQPSGPKKANPNLQSININVSHPLRCFIFSQKTDWAALAASHQQAHMDSQGARVLTSSPPCTALCVRLGGQFGVRAQNQHAHTHTNEHAHTARLRQCQKRFETVPTHGAQAGSSGDARPSECRGSGAQSRPYRV